MSDKISLVEDFSPKPGVTFLANRPYKVRDKMLRSMNVWHENGTWYNIPNQYIKGTAISGVEDEGPWEFIAKEADVTENMAKFFMMEFMLDADSLPGLARAHELSAQQVKHIIIAFNKWTGAE